MKKISPGFAWLLLLLWFICSIIYRYIRYIYGHETQILYRFGFDYAIFLIIFGFCIAAHIPTGIMKKISPGFAWLGLFLWAIYSIVHGYKTQTLYQFRTDYAIFLIIFGLCIAYTYNYDQKKSKSGALTSFIFSLTFWIPLINLIFCALGSIIGYKSLANIRKNSKHFGGKWFIIICFILTGIVYITYFIGVGLCFSGMNGICSNIGFAFMAD